MMQRRIMGAVRHLTTLAEVRTAIKTHSSNQGTQSRDGSMLGRKIIVLVDPKCSVLPILNKYKEEQGNVLVKHELSRIIFQLRLRKRFQHSLQICEWMTRQEGIKLFSGDYAVHLDLIAKLHGLSSAEKFFEDMPKEMRALPTFSTLLHTYVQHCAYDKAEFLMKKILEFGYVNSPLPFNHMISMYLKNGQLEKIPPLIKELKKNTKPDIISYNLWLTMCQSQNDVGAAESVFFEMNEGGIKPEWMTYSILTSLYLKNGLNDRARVTLQEMGQRIPKNHRSGFSSLISLHSYLGNVKEIGKMWKKMKSFFGKLNDAEYTCIISSLIKLGDLNKAGKIYNEWESTSPRSDSRVPNLLVRAYIDLNQMERARNFCYQFVQKGIKPSYATWELFTWGYLRLKQTEQVLECFENAVRSVKKWEPNMELIREVYKLLKEQENLVGAEKFLSVLRNAGYVTTEIYNMLIRTYVKAERMPPVIAVRMAMDNVSPDEKTEELIRIISRKCVSDVYSDL